MKRFSALCLFLALAGCGASSPGEEVDGPDAGGDADAGVGPVALEIDPLPATWQYLSIPVTGKGPARGTLVFDVPGRGQFQRGIASDGTFCVNVPLVAQAEASIRFQAISADGGYSEAVVVKTTQAGTPDDPDDPGGEVTMRNLAEDYASNPSNVETWNIDNYEDAAFSLLTDGSATGFTELYEDWGSDGSLILKFEKAPVYSIQVSTTADCPMESFYWYLANTEMAEDDLGSPWDNGSSEWDLQGEIVDNEQKTLTLMPIFGEPTANWMGIYFNSEDCDGGTFSQGHHKITEITVTTRSVDDGPPPDDGTPMCPAS
jgi:hypothetical protein